MKNYRITVNGVAYDVAVEELGAGEASAAQDGVIASVEVAVGDMVEGGDVLATMN